MFMICNIVYGVEHIVHSNTQYNIYVNKGNILLQSVNIIRTAFVTNYKLS